MQTKESELQSQGHALSSLKTSLTDSERMVEERELLDSYQYHQQRKNDQEPERAIERKTVIGCIVAKPEKK